MAPEDAPLLELDRVSLSYGRGVVVDDVLLTVRPGEVVAIMGPNGAGKTTLLRGIVGLADLVGGHISFAGTPMRRARPDRAAAMGIAYVPQGRMLFPYTTGTVNLWSGGYPRRDRRGVAEAVTDFIRTWPIAERVARRQAVTMSGGEQQVVAIGRAMVAAPRLVLIDEPSLGLAPVILKDVARIIDELTSDLSASGVGVLLVEQHVELALAVADRVCMLSAGRVVLEAERDAISAAEIAQIYMR